MKKLCFIGIILALTPSLSFGDNFRINKLVQEKQRKMAELEKCMGSTKGLKIAGISTLGLTAVGVVKVQQTCGRFAFIHLSSSDYNG